MKGGSRHHFCFADLATQTRWFGGLPQITQDVLVGFGKQVSHDISQMMLTLAYSGKSLTVYVPVNLDGHQKFNTLCFLPFKLITYDTLPLLVYN